MAKYKNISKEDLTLVNVGIVKSGEVVELPEDFHNANFEKIKKQPEQPGDKNK
jgi:hypothetical protein